jgi:hypothetical protein
VIARLPPEEIGAEALHVVALLAARYPELAAKVSTHELRRMAAEQVMAVVRQRRSRREGP